MFALCANAQTNQPSTKKSGEEKKETKYCCPKCTFSDMKAGKCPTDLNELVLCGIVGSYYCPVCMLSCEKAGMCPKCGKEMKKAEPKKEEKKTEVKTKSKK